MNMKSTKELMDFSLKNAAAVTILTLTYIEHSLASLQAFWKFPCWNRLSCCQCHVCHFCSGVCMCIISGLSWFPWKINSNSLNKSTYIVLLLLLIRVSLLTILSMGYCTISNEKCFFFLQNMTNEVWIKSCKPRWKLDILHDDYYLL